MTTPTAQHLTCPNPTRRVGVAGASTIGVSFALFVRLDAQSIVATGSRLESTISAYGLGAGRWIFTVAVLLLGAGSTALLVALVGRRLTHWKAGAAIAMFLWIAGLVVIAVFPKQDWSQAESIGGTIHRTGSALAFISLPVAAVLLARPWVRHRVHAVHARRTLILGSLAIASFTPILYAMVVAVFTGVEWWTVITLGHSERLLAVSEVAALGVIGAWALART